MRTAAFTPDHAALSIGQTVFDNLAAKDCQEVVVRNHGRAQSRGVAPDREPLQIVMRAGVGLQNHSLTGKADSGQIEPPQTGGKTARAAKLTLQRVKATVGADGGIGN